MAGGFFSRRRNVLRRRHTRSNSHKRWQLFTILVSFMAALIHKIARFTMKRVFDFTPIIALC